MKQDKKKRINIKKFDALRKEARQPLHGSLEDIVKPLEEETRKSKRQAPKHPPRQEPRAREEQRKKKEEDIIAKYKALIVELHQKIAAADQARLKYEKLLKELNLEAYTLEDLKEYQGALLMVLNTFWAKEAKEGYTMSDKMVNHLEGFFTHLQHLILPVRV